MNEVQMIDWLPKLVPTFGNPIRVVELGAHDGYHTRMIAALLSRTGRPWEFVAVEADPRINPVLPPFVTFIRAAVGRENGHADFYLSSGMSDEGMSYPGSSSLHPPGPLIHQYWPKMEFKEKATVEVLTLDTICERCKLGWIDFVWCDIQGCEGDAFMGATRMLPNIKWFFTEYSAAPLYQGQAVFEDLKQLVAPHMVVHTDMHGDALFSAAALQSFKL